MNTDQSSAVLALTETSSHPSISLAWGRQITPVSVDTDDDNAIFAAQRGRTDICLFGPVGAPASASQFLGRYLDRQRDDKRRTVIVQVLSTELPQVIEHGMISEVLGRNYSISLADFTRAGRPMAKIRQNINRAHREGVTVRELTHLSRDVAETINRDWLGNKGEHTKMLEVLVGEDNPPPLKPVRIFTAYRDGIPIAYVMYSKSYGDADGWLYDLTRRRSDAPIGTIELINMTALEIFKSEGSRWLHLGLTPFVGLTEETRLGHSRILSATLRCLADHGQRLYPSITQERFKLKWNPHTITEEYISFHPKVSLPAVYDLMKTVNII